MTLPEAASACIGLIKCNCNLLEVVIDASALKLGYPVQNYAIVTVKSSHDTNECCISFIVLPIYSFYINISVFNYSSHAHMGIVVVAVGFITFHIQT